LLGDQINYATTLISVHLPGVGHGAG